MSPKPASAATAFDSLFADFEAQKPAALARVLSIVENHRTGFDRLLSEFHTHQGRARRIGLTGPPGAGKSSITSRIVADLRSAGHKVAVVAVDPTSPFTGGALLGDRVRMENVALDPGVFIRSMATRGSLGGLATATREVADVLDAFGFDRILIETVGVGQSELDVARIADSTVVVLVPESGDSIQTLKAGVMEIADIFVVNKSDRPGADRLRMDIELMLGMRRGGTMKNVPAHHGLDLKRARAKPGSSEQGGPATDITWVPPVITTVATDGTGITELMETIDRHFAYLERTGELRERRLRRLRTRVVDVVEQKIRQRLWTDDATSHWLDARLTELESGATTPFAVADELLGRSGALLAGEATEPLRPRIAASGGTSSPAAVKR